VHWGRQCRALQKAWVPAAAGTAFRASQALRTQTRARHGPRSARPCACVTSWARRAHVSVRPRARAAADGAPDAAEVAAAAGLAAELALLGAGDADRLFPASLDDAYAAGADEAEWRVML